MNQRYGLEIYLLSDAICLGVFPCDHMHFSKNKSHFSNLIVCSIYEVYDIFYFWYLQYLVHIVYLIRIEIQ